MELPSSAQRSVDDAGRRAALIVANDEFADATFAKLRAPAADAKELAEVLGDPEIGNFDVKIAANLPLQGLRETIVEFFKDRKTKDLLLLYMSSHGVTDVLGRFYYVAADTRMEMLGATGLEDWFINNAMSGSGSQRQILVLDCCFSGTFIRNMTPRSGGGRANLEPLFSSQGVAVVTSSDAFEYAMEDADITRNEPRPSVFTRSVVQGLRTGAADLHDTGKVTVHDLYEYVVDAVADTVEGQTPRWNNCESVLYVGYNPNHVAELSADLLAARSGSLYERRGAILDLRMMARSPVRAIALSGRRELERYVEDKYRDVSDDARSALAELDGQELASRDDAETARRDEEQRAREEADQQRRDAESERRERDDRITRETSVRLSAMPDELRNALKDRLPEIRLAAVIELGRLLRDRDQRVVAAARQELAALLDDDSRRVVEAAARLLKEGAEGIEGPAVYPSMAAGDMSLDVSPDTRAAADVSKPHGDLSNDPAGALLIEAKSLRSSDTERAINLAGRAVLEAHDPSVANEALSIMMVSPIRSRGWFLSRAEGGDGRAMFGLAALFGLGGYRDASQKWMQRSVQRGDEFAKRHESEK